MGRMPPYEFVDIKFRNNQIRRNVEPSKWRWKSWGWPSDWDIVSWQVSTENEKK
jgi:hypothetical protein